MKLIESKAEYIPQEDGLEGIYKIIELAGRTAYKSEDKIVNVISIDIADLPEGITVKNIPNYKTNQQQCIEYLRNHKIKYKIISSAKAFVDRMIKSKHGAALEHGTIYLKMPYDTIYDENPYSNSLWDGHDMFVTTNYRVLQENEWLDDLKYLCKPTDQHEKRYTMRFTCSRAIAQELTRHRVFSYLMESQRYINYSKERHGGDITFIEPSWLKEMSYDIEEKFIESLSQAEDNYMWLVHWLQPQQARDVLPNATKTELIMTGFASDWRFLMDLRLFEKTGAVHPDMKDLMQKAQKAMQEAGIWEDIMSKPSKFE
jgi:thymidylate synthase (FAD)